MSSSYVPMRRRSRMFASTAVAVVAVTMMSLSASPAQAATEMLDPANEIAAGTYTLTIAPTGRTAPLPGYDSALQNGPDSISITAGCPEGYRSGSRSYLLLPNGERIGGGGPGRYTAEGVGFGLDGQPVHLSGDSMQPGWWGTASNAFLTGTMKYVITCDNRYLSDSQASPIGDSKYFVKEIDVDVAAKTWQVNGEAVKVGTSTQFAATDVTHNSATVTATVTPAGATGTVQFEANLEPIGAPVTVDASGIATLHLTGLNPDDGYSFVARYSGDATHEASASAATFVPTPAAPEEQDNASADLNLTVPPATTGEKTGLKITVKPTAIPLTGVTPNRTTGQIWEATGSLGNITVNDDRQEANGAGWTLNGKVSPFTSGSNSIAASNFGWTPSKSEGPATAGGGVEAGVDGGLAADKPLASLAAGQGVATPNVRTVVSADLRLKVPAEAVEGAYAGTLTLTLI